MGIILGKIGDGVHLVGAVDVGYQRTGMASLLAPLHIAVVAAETIVPQPRDLFREDVLGGKGLVRNFVFITGPSATADMGPLVRGVHGARTVCTSLFCDKTL